MRITVIGAANIDITAFIKGEVLMHDSNISTVRYSFGDVGRNVAHNCALLGLSPRFICAAGRSASTDAMLSELSEAGADVLSVLRTEEFSTGSYISFIDPSGEMLIAANDMAVNTMLTPGYLRGLDLDDGLKAFDANLTEETIGYIASLPGIKYAEPVSAVKCRKLLPVMGRIDLIKPNLLEAEALTGISIRSEKDIIAAGRRLNALGVRYACITAGKKGAYLFGEGHALHEPSFDIEPVSATGAGDAFGAGLIYGVSKGLNPRDTLRVASAMAFMALSGEEAVNPGINETEILKKAGIKFTNEEL